MIKVSTVFILGAAASTPLAGVGGSKKGFMTATMMKDDICQHFLNPQAKHWEKAAENTGLPEGDFREMAKGLRGSRSTSIDAWLADNPEYVAVGRVCIAKWIIGMEHSSLFAPGRANGDWYADMWHSYLKQTENGAGADSIAENRVTFVTFNYDRSLEHSLYEMIGSTYSKLMGHPAAVHKLTEIINEIRIFHVYGQVGRLPWQPKTVATTVWPFGERPANETKAWQKAKECEKLVLLPGKGDRGMTEPNFERARLAIAEAERVYFLGFGYHDENLKRIKPHKLQAKVVEGTAYGLYGRTVKRLNDKNNAFGCSIVTAGRDLDVLGFLRSRVGYA